MKDDLIPLMTTAATALGTFLKPIREGVDTISNYFSAAEGPSAAEINTQNREAVKETFNEIIGGLNTIVTDFKSWVNQKGNKTDMVIPSLPGSLMLYEPDE